MTSLFCSLFFSPPLSKSLVCYVLHRRLFGYATNAESDCCMPPSSLYFFIFYIINVVFIHII